MDTNNIDKNILSDDSILDIITNLYNFNDLENMCKSSKRIMDICKNRRLTICKSFLKNIGYTNFGDITESPCKLMLELRKLPKNLNKTVIRQLFDNPDPSKKEVLRFLSINGKIDDNILYDLAYEEIGRDNERGVVKLHEITNYNFKNPDPNRQKSLVLLATLTRNIRILKFILENGGDIYDDELLLVKNRSAQEFIQKYPDNIKERRRYEISDDISSYFGFI